MRVMLMIPHTAIRLDHTRSCLSIRMDFKPTVGLLQACQEETLVPIPETAIAPE